MPTPPLACRCLPPSYSTTATPSAGLTSIPITAPAPNPGRSWTPSPISATDELVRCHSCSSRNGPRQPGTTPAWQRLDHNTAGTNTIAAFDRHLGGTLTAEPGWPFTAGGAGTGAGLASQGRPRHAGWSSAP